MNHELAAVEHGSPVGMRTKGRARYKAAVACFRSRRAQRWNSRLSQLQKQGVSDEAARASDENGFIDDQRSLVSYLAEKQANTRLNSLEPSC